MSEAAPQTTTGTPPAPPAAVDDLTLHARPGDREWPYEWIGPFLEALSVRPVIASAARHAGVTRQRVYQVRDQNPEFATAWREALEESLDVLEDYAVRMGTNGVEVTETRTRTVRERNPSGELVVTQRTTDEVTRRFLSPQLTMFLLAAHRPEKYRRARYEEEPANLGGIESQLDDAVAGLEADVVRLSDARSARQAAQAARG